MSTQNFAPEGHNGGSHSRDGEHDRRESRPEPEHNHDFDDGLVHEHDWARSSNDR